jgi:anti-sigma28 factor (negative regulator of flagellin synthesis)
MPSVETTQHEKQAKLRNLYERMSDEELKSIIEDARYTMDAKEVARSVVTSRQNS